MYYYENSVDIYPRMEWYRKVQPLFSFRKSPRSTEFSIGASAAVVLIVVILAITGRIPELDKLPHWLAPAIGSSGIIKSVLTRIVVGKRPQGDNSPSSDEHQKQPKSSGKQFAK
jgi:hypothetical protein